MKNKTTTFQILSLVWLISSTAFCQDTDTASAPVNELIPSEILEKCRPSHAELDLLKHLLPQEKYTNEIEFMKTHNPYLLAEIARFGPLSPVQKKQTLIKLQQSFRKLRESRSESVTFQRTAELQRMESIALLLADIIKKTEDPGEKSELKQHLEQLVEKTVVAHQQNQLIELNRLEHEISEMRRMLQLRQSNINKIIEERFNSLLSENHQDNE